LRTFNTATGEPLGKPIQLDAHAAHVAISPDNTMLAVFDRNRTLQFRDLATGYAIGPVLGVTIEGNSPADRTVRVHANGLRFSDDGRYLVAGYQDSAVRMFAVPARVLLPADSVRKVIEARTGTSLTEDSLLSVLDQAEWQSRKAEVQALSGQIEGELETRAMPNYGRAPDLTKVHLLHQDEFQNPQSGFNVLKNTQAKSASFYHQGQFIIRSEQKNHARRSSPWQVSDMACQVRARSFGSPDDHWSLVLSYTDAAGQAGVLSIHLLARGAVEVSFPRDGKDEVVGPITHGAIKPAPAYNDLLAVVRGRQLLLFVNGLAICDPIVLPQELPPARLMLGGRTASGGQSEFESIRVWDASSIPSEGGLGPPPSKSD
jgi:hypothetical protein